ncbi:MAG: hypothetical protein IJA12_04335, partial [Oscillospiraceae bacterium]|nr:hypothetical protein [Oscillospiraceae bacterium]
MKTNNLCKGDHWSPSVCRKSSCRNDFSKLKVSVKPFQRLAVSKGRAFGRHPQMAKYPIEGA